MSIIPPKRCLKENKKDGKIHQENIKSNSEKITLGYITWDKVELKAKIIISGKGNCVEIKVKFVLNIVCLTYKYV